MKSVILMSITGRQENDWQEKLQEIKNIGIKEVALFLSMFEKEQREKIYRALPNSPIASIPLVHIRHDMTHDELAFLKNRYGSRYFTCHEENFENDDLKIWEGFHQDIYLEMNFDDFVSEKVKVEKIGGFCVDLAHFKVAMEKKSKEFEYILKRKEQDIFKCNHLGGYNPKNNIDMHTIDHLKNFDYLGALPHFIFGNVIALEVFNPIREQLEFKKYLKEHLLI